MAIASGSVLLGLEHEFRVLRHGVAVDFRRILPKIGVKGRRLDPGDPNGIRTPLGLTITCDAAEAELAMPPVDLGPGVTDRMLAWAGAGAGLLTSHLGGYELEGYSTHLSVGVSDSSCRAVCERFTRTFAPALMLLLDGEDSPGLLVRPRRGRVELGTDYATGSDLAAGVVMAAGTVLACLAVEAGEVSAAALPRELVVAEEPAIERFGWYVDRRAFGSDLYSLGRETVLRTLDGSTVTAQEQLEQSWKIARRFVEQRVDPGDLRAADDLVSGVRPLPLEEARGRSPSVPRPAPPSVEARTLPTVERPAFMARVVAATWHYAVFELSGPRTVYASVPRSGLEGFLDDLSAGALDAHIEAQLLTRDRGTMLTSYHQAVAAAAVWDDIAGWESLAPPEPDLAGVVRLAESTRAGPPPPGAGGSPASSAGPSGEVMSTASAGAPDVAVINDRPKGPRPPLPPPEDDRRWAWWVWVLIVLVVLVIVLVVTLVLTGGDDESVVGPTEEPVVVDDTDADDVIDEPSGDDSGDDTDTGGDPVEEDQQDEQPPVPPFVVPEGYDDWVEIGRMAGLGRTDLESTFALARSDEMGTSIYSRSDTPAGVYTEAIDQWDTIMFRSQLPEARSAALFGPGGPFACGSEQGGAHTLCSQENLEFPAGDMVVVVEVMVGAVAPDPARQYTYAAVFESNSDPVDDFVFNPPFDWDYFRGTDAWFVFDSFQGQVFFGFFPGDFFSPRPTAARVVIRGNTVVYLIPGSDLPDPTGGRTTSFEHDGTFDPLVSGGDVSGVDPTQPLLDIPQADLAFDGDTDPVVIEGGADDSGVTPTDGESSDDPSGSEAGAPSTQEETVESFVAAFDEALRTQNLDFLFDRLHPVALAAVPPGVCETFIETQFVDAAGLELAGPVEGPTSITFDTPDGPVVVDDHYTAQVVLSFQGQSFDVQGAYALVDGRMHWLSSCS